MSPRLREHAPRGDPCTLYGYAISNRLDQQASTDSAMVDAETVRNVELLGPLLSVGGAASGGGKRLNNSLFGLLNHCATPGGVRHLRASLYQPPVRQDIIQRRLDAIQVLFGHWSI